MSDVQRHDEIQGDIVHVYDGIEEADNELPRWWLATFFGAIVFGLVYYQVYETWHVAPSTRELYASEMAARLTSGGEVTDDVLVTLSQDPTTVESGHAIFVTNCVVCHGDQAQGNIGPNLTDDHWIHGGAPTNIFTTVHDGVGARGMPQWGPVLGEQSVQSVVAYVLTLRDTNVAGRPPEGEVYVPGGAAPPSEADEAASEGEVAPSEGEVAPSEAGGDTAHEAEGPTAEALAPSTPDVHAPE